MSTMLHTVTEMFWMKRDACATKIGDKNNKKKFLGSYNINDIICKAVHASFERYE